MHAFQTRTLEELELQDEEALSKVPYYAALKRALVEARVPFLVLPEVAKGRADHALLLNVLFWNPSSVDDVIHIPVVSGYSVPHIAWHTLAQRFASNGDGRMSAEAMLLGECIASAFDMFILGHLLREAPASPLVQLLFDRMLRAGLAAGVSEDHVRGLAASVREQPEAGFADLLEILFLGANALYGCRTSEEGLAVLEQIDAAPMGCLFHGYRVAEWILQIKAISPPIGDERVEQLFHKLREQAAPVTWLVERWVNQGDR